MESVTDTAECIHGFAPGLCATCSPAEPPPAVRRAPAPRRAAPVRTPAPPSISVADQRVYHVLHVDDLETAIASGVGATPPSVQVLSELALTLRADAEIGPGESVAGFVPFLLAPDADRWSTLRDGATGPDWSDAARRAAPADFVLLVSTLDRLGDVVLADGDAAGSLTRFAHGDDLRRMLVRLHDADTRAGAEALAPAPVPWSAVTLIGVANDRVRDRVRPLTTTRVAVYPPWFAGPDV